VRKQINSHGDSQIRVKTARFLTAAIADCVRKLSIPDKQNDLFRRHLGFLLFVVGFVLVFWMPLRRLISFSLTHDYGSYIIFVVPASAYLIYLKRHEIFSSVQADLRAGSVLFLAGTILWWLAERYSPPSPQGDYLSLVILAIVIIWMSGFIFCYGTRAFTIGTFPLLFLLLLVPIPVFLIEKVIFLLQAGSTAVAYWLLRLLGVAVFKQGFILNLPTLDVEVAKQCSGIRSSLALLITTLLAGEFVLRSGWRKSLLIFSVVPILILKNGARIVAVSLLAIYVDRGFLHGWLHTSGGILFYLLGLVMLIPVMTALRKSEDKSSATRSQNPAFSSADVVGLKS
jgi:exosortase